MTQPKPQRTNRPEGAARPVLIIDTWTDQDRRTNGVIRNPEDIRSVEEMFQLSADDIVSLHRKPKWDEHHELKWRLESGTLYCTDTGRVGGVMIDWDGIWYVSDRHPRLAIRVGKSVKVQYHRRRKPAHADVQGRHHSRNVAYRDE